MRWIKRNPRPLWKESSQRTLLNQKRVYMAGVFAGLQNFWEAREMELGSAYLLHFPHNSIQQIHLSRSTLESSLQHLAAELLHLNICPNLISHHSPSDPHLLQSQTCNLLQHSKLHLSHCQPSLLGCLYLPQIRCPHYFPPRCKELFPFYSSYGESLQL